MPLEPLYQGRPASYWVAQLQDLSPDFREQAKHALRQFGPAAVEDLISALPEWPSEPKGDVFDLLIEIGPASVAGLVASLENGNRAPIWHLIVTALVRIGSPAVPALIEAAPRAAAFCLSALRRLGPRAAPAVPTLLAMLADEEPDDAGGKRNIIDTLGAIGPAGGNTAPVIAKYLDDADDYLSATAVIALLSFGAAASTYLGRALRSSVAARRLHAVECVGSLKQEAAALIPDLRRLLQEEVDSDQVRRDVINLLGSLGAAALPAVPDLIDELLDPDISGVCEQEAAAKALGRLGSTATAALPVLAELVGGSSWAPEEARFAALCAMWDIGLNASVVPSLMQALVDEDAQSFRDLVAESLGAIGRPASAALPLLVAALGDEDVEVRDSALIAICQIGPDRSHGALLLAAMRNPNEEVRVAATRELGKLGRAVRGAHSALVERLLDDASAVRREALDALVIVGVDSKAMSPLTRLLVDPEHRVLAAYLLGSLGCEARDAIPELKLALALSSPGSQEVIEQALSDIMGDSEPV